LLVPGEEVCRLLAGQTLFDASHIGAPGPPNLERIVEADKHNRRPKAPASHDLLARVLCSRIDCGDARRTRVEGAVREGSQIHKTAISIRVPLGQKVWTIPAPVEQEAFE
jgi:hypothetical protein